MSVAPHETVAASDLQLEDQLIENSVALRLHRMDLRCEGKPFDLAAYPYLMDPYDDDCPDITMRKGSQMGMTIMCVLRTLIRCESMYPRGVLYMMPTKDDVADFARARFDRILRENPLLRNMVRGTDSANIKRIGNAICYFRGARSRSQLKSIPVDGIVYDELDEMSLQMVALADKRLDGSSFKHRFRISTPTLPDFGIDYHYLQSDQRVWQVKCEACNQWSCLELLFPQCLRRLRDGVVIKVCTRCDRPLRVAKAEWVPKRLGIDRHGYWVSQLNSPTVDPTVILNEYEDPRTVLSEFFNHRLAMSYADLEDLLDDATINACLRERFLQHSDEGPCIMGADIGKRDIHYIIGKKTGELSVDVLDLGKLVGDDAFASLADKLRRFHVEVAVLDEMAETRSVRDFKSQHKGVYGCWYSAAQRREPDWNYVEMTVQCNRTASLDASHKLFTRSMITLPRCGDLWEPFKNQLKNMARQKTYDDRTGDPTVVWIVRGVKNDHWRHAVNYLRLAMEIAAVAKVVQRARGRGRRKYRRGTWMSR